MSTWLNPATQDYQRINGILTSDPYAGIANAVYLRLRTPLGLYWGDPTLGSRLHELSREKNVPRVFVLAQQYGQQALQPLVDQGRVKSIVVTTQQPTPGYLYLQMEVTMMDGNTRQFQHFVKVL